VALHPALSMHKPLPGAKQRLICLAHAGGGASAFRQLKEALAPHGVDVCPIQLPGRENRMSEPLLQTAKAVVEHVHAACAQLSPLPTTIIGHSMGSLIGYLLTLKWQQEGKAPPVRFIASASNSPVTRTRLSSTYNLPDAEFKKKVFEHDGVPAQLREMPELFDMFVPILRADYGVCDTYIHEIAEPLTCPVSVYGGLEDNSVPVHRLDEWQEIAEEPVTVRQFTGGHFYLYQQIEAVVPKLIEDMQAV